MWPSRDLPTYRGMHPCSNWHESCIMMEYVNMYITQWLWINIVTMIDEGTPLRIHFRTLLKFTFIGSRLGYLTRETPSHTATRDFRT